MSFEERLTSPHPQILTSENLKFSHSQILEFHNFRVVLFAVIVARDAKAPE